MVGLAIFGLGFSISGYLLVLFFMGRIATVHDHLALLLLAILLMIIGVQFITSGITAEITARIYYKTQNKKIMWLKI